MTAAGFYIITSRSGTSISLILSIITPGTTVAAVLSINASRS